VINLVVMLLLNMNVNEMLKVIGSFFGWCFNVSAFSCVYGC
jgi:hypothetical protein